MEDFSRERSELNLRELAERIAALVPEDGVQEPSPGIRLTRASRTTEQVYGTSKTAFCIIARGAKEIHLGERRLRYDSDHYLLATVELPIQTIIFASPEEGPYLAFRMDLDAALVGSVMVEAGLVASPAPPETGALGVSRLDSGLLDASARLVRLLSSTEEARVLLPAVKREVVYRLLIGEQGQRLRHLPAPSGHSNRIAQALERLRRDFDKALSIEHLAEELGMSSTRFHHHFKSVTDMSPLQFQKQLRLQEARRLMLGENLDASSAAFQVGYEDASHFSRDYKKHFGEPPLRDVEKLRAMVAAE